MVFLDDSSGFAFSCGDAKISMGTGSWGARLSQIARVTGSIYIVTGRLLDPDYVSRILGKRPHKISIIANASARKEASVIKRSFPDVRLALHGGCNAKVVLVEPDTVWVSSADFGRPAMVESTVGLHSSRVFNRAVESFFRKLWSQSLEIP
ncbi:hypothetical protein [Variovorax guangxiensis]|nr:hypothetical protein [Variovorax guangxiensis]